MNHFNMTVKIIEYISQLLIAHVQFQLYIQPVNESTVNESTQ